ncbi:UNVERIFIED_CONTAM: hypothetical protein K2H54_047131 [Gekko kuhli]
MLSNIMASGAAGTATTINPVSEEHLDKSLKLMEKSILDSIAAIMRPMYEQMEKLQKDVNENRIGTERALNIGLNNQREIQQLQQMDDVLAEKALRKEINLRQQNLKIRGWPEKLEKKGKTYRVSSKDEGTAALQNLNLTSPMELQEASNKRKCSSPLSLIQEDSERQEDIN